MSSLEENYAAQEDEIYQKMFLDWYREKDPQVKEQKGLALDEYWAKRRKELGFQDEEEIRKQKEEQQKKNEIAQQEYIEWVNEQVSKGIPARFVLYCNYPGLEFKTELDTDDIEASYEDDYDGYWEELYWQIDYELCNAFDGGIETLLDAHYTEDDVSPKLYFDYSEVTMPIQEAIPHNDKVKIFLDSFDSDGNLIETQEIHIMDFFDRHPDYFQEGGMWNATNEYISASQSKFIRDGEWLFGLRDDKNHCEIENPEEWPAPKADGTWIDEDGNELHPLIWYSINRPGVSEFEDPWVLNGKNLDFWLSGSGAYFLEYSYDGHAGCYSGKIPCMKELREKCPVKLEDDDTPESLKEKIQAFFVEEYRKAHQ